MYWWYGSEIQLKKKPFFKHPCQNSWKKGLIPNKHLVSWVPMRRWENSARLNENRVSWFFKVMPCRIFKISYFNGESFSSLLITYSFCLKIMCFTPKAFTDFYHFLKYPIFKCFFKIKFFSYRSFRPILIRWSIVVLGKQ